MTMSEKSKENLKNTVTQSLTDKLPPSPRKKRRDETLWFKVSTKIEYKVKRVPIVTKKFIKHKIQYSYWLVKTILNWLGFRHSKYYILDIVVTGIIIQVIVVLWHSTRWRFISYGLLVAITTYYIKWFRKLQLAQTTYDVDNITQNGTTSNEHYQD